MQPDLAAQKKRMAQDSERSLREALAAVPLIHFACDGNGRLTQLEGGGIERLELPSAAWLGRCVFDWLTNESNLRANLDRVLQGQSFEGVVEFRGLFWETRCAPLWDAARRPIGCAGWAMDVTARQRAEQALRENERHYRLLAENATDMITRLDPHGTILYASPASYALLGYRPEELLGQSGFALAHPDELLFQQHTLQVLLVSAGPVTVGYRVRQKNGEYVWVESTVRGVRAADTGEVTEIIAVSRDITERKKTEEALRKSEELIRRIVETAPVAIIHIDEDEKVLSWNPAAERIFGWRGMEVLGRRLPIATPEQRDEFEKLFDPTVRGVLGDGVEVRRLRKDGSLVDVAIWTAPQRDETGCVVSSLGVIADVTRRKRIEAALQESLEAERRFLEQLRTLNEAARELSRTGSFDELCRRTIEFGRDRLGFDRLGLWFLSDDPAMLQGSYGIDETGQIRDEREERLPADSGDYVRPFFEYERPLTFYENTSLHNARGERVGSGSHAKAALWDGEKVLGLLCCDNLLSQRPITERDRELLALYAAAVGHLCTRQRTEEQWRQAQKMEAVGRLAGGVAHDFNNLLTAIRGFTELAAREAPAVGTLADHLREIRRAADSAADLTRQLLTFARRQIVEPTILNLNDVLRRTGNMLRRFVGEDIVLVVAPAADLWNIRADAGQIEQILVNLAANARDAMPRGGTLRLVTENAFLDKRAVRHGAGLKPGEYVRLTVQDTGLGIEPAAQPHIFEPFFTTKEKGRGTGLGLATVHGIVQQSGGHIELHSEAGHGAIFHIYLPRARATVKQAAMPAMPAEMPRGNETVLVVEDEPLVRGAATLTLRMLGYHVLEAGSGPEALRVARDHAGRIHILFTDLVMPRLNGRELAQYLRQERPETRVLYTSGYSDETHARAGGPATDGAFLQKPYAPADLARRLRETLDVGAEER